MTSDDHEWLSRLWAAHASKVYAYAARRVGARHAEDVVAMTFVVAWRRREPRPHRELPWLYGVARRVIADLRRTERRRGDLASRAAAASSVRQASTDPTGDAALATHAVGKALAGLSAADREVLRLATWERLDPPDAASVLGISVTAFRMRLSRARRRIAAATADMPQPDPPPAGNGGERRGS